MSRKLAQETEQEGNAAAAGGEVPLLTPRRTAGRETQPPQAAEYPFLTPRRTAGRETQPPQAVEYPFLTPRRTAGRETQPPQAAEYPSLDSDAPRRVAPQCVDG